MNENSQNALLKNLEEPPDHIIFILTTDNVSKLRETIRSRCWIIDFQPLSNDELTSALVTYFDINKENAAAIAPFSGGSLERALELLELDMTKIKNATIEFLRNALAGRFHSAKSILDDSLDKFDATGLTLYLRMILHWLGDVRAYQAGTDNLYFSDFPETFERFTSKFPNANIEDTFQQLERYINILNTNNTNPNIVLANTIMKLAELTIPTIKEEV
jgi:DNA polymerase-3 subunit delta'